MLNINTSIIKIHKHKISIVLLSIIIVAIVAIALWQSDENLAKTYFKEGELKFKYKKYKEADSLFTLSIAKVPKPESYYMLGLSKYNLNNKCGYCENMQIAAKLGDPDAYRLFYSYCLKRDSINYINPTHKDYFYYSIITTYPCNSIKEQMFYIKNLINGKTVAFTVSKNDSLSIEIEDFKTYFPELNKISPKRIKYHLVNNYKL